MAIYTESAFQRDVERYAQQQGWLFYHPHLSRRDRAGFPDITLVRDGTLIFAELKVGRNRPSVAQREWLHALHDAGVQAYVWWPSDMEEIRAVLR